MLSRPYQTSPLITLADYLVQVEPPIAYRTLCFLLSDDGILLGRRKRGWGPGKYAGSGGRVEREREKTLGAISYTLAPSPMPAFFWWRCCVLRPRYAAI